MYRIIIAFSLLIFSLTSLSSQDCVDIDTKEFTSYLNRHIKPRLDMKLDKEDGFLAIRGNRQDFSVPVVKVKAAVHTWEYNFLDVRRIDSNFFFDKKKNKIVLDIKFDGVGPEIKGRCPSCIRPSRDSRAPDIEWDSPQILRLFMSPVIYQNSISLVVKDIRMIGNLKANGLGSMMGGLTENIKSKLKTEMQRLFSNGQTQRLFNDAIRPLLNAHQVERARSVTLASSSLRMCK